MKRRRVKITGIGFVTPAGIGKDEFRRGILAPVSYVAPVTRFPEAAGAFVASEVRGFEISDFTQFRGASRLPRHAQFALAATNLAMADAGVTHEMYRHLGPVVITGTSLMDSDVVNKTIENVALKGPRYALPRVVFHASITVVAA